MKFSIKIPLNNIGLRQIEVVNILGYYIIFRRNFFGFWVYVSVIDFAKMVSFFDGNNLATKEICREMHPTEWGAWFSSEKSARTTARYWIKWKRLTRKGKKK